LSVLVKAYALANNLVIKGETGRTGDTRTSVIKLHLNDAATSLLSRQQLIQGCLVSRTGLGQLPLGAENVAPQLGVRGGVGARFNSVQDSQRAIMFALSQKNLSQAVACQQ